MKKIFLTILILFAISVPLGSAEAQAPIKILIVPGHDEESYGAQYGKLKEADMTLALATELYDILSKDSRFDVYITRDSSGYTEEFKEYLWHKKDEIKAFRKEAKLRNQKEIRSGKVKVVDGAPHNNVTADTSNVLYGINKWANDNLVDAVVHVHFNDHVRKNIWADGKYKGFAIYVPEGQRANSIDSTDLAKAIFKKLKENYSVSTYSAEAKGIVPDQELIALGANGTLFSSVKSVLVEYGYIYRFGDKSFRQKAYKDMAERTAQGIKDYFGIEELFSKKL